MRIGRLLSVLSVVALFSASVRAELLVTINKSTQKMTVAVDGATRYVWPVSTGAPGYDTPSGQFKPFRMEEDHFSKEWDDAPMPHSIFFTMQGHAIHGSMHTKAIGTPASHGCVRLEPKNAAILFALVKREKMANTRVELIGETPTSTGVPVARREPPQRRYVNDYQRSTGTDDIDTDDTAAIVQQRRQRVVQPRDDDDAQPYEYEQDGPYYRPRRYGYDQPQPFGWQFGR
jgi:hypothetical protein